MRVHVKSYGLSLSILKIEVRSSYCDECSSAAIHVLSAPTTAKEHMVAPKKGLKNRKVAYNMAQNL